MKKLVFLLVMLLAATMVLAALDFTSVDNLYDAGEDQKVYDTLQSMLKEAKTADDKAGVLWRLSRVCVDLGDALEEGDKKGKFAI